LSVVFKDGIVQSKSCPTLKYSVLRKENWFSKCLRV